MANTRVFFHCRQGKKAFKGYYERNQILQRWSRRQPLIFPIVVNLTELQEKLSDIIADTIKVTADQLADCGKLAPILILDKKGYPIQDMADTREDLQ